MTADPFLQALPQHSVVPVAVQVLHSSSGAFSGQCRIERGKGRISRLIMKIAGFPSAGCKVPVRLTVGRIGKRWSWERDFDGQKTRSFLTYDARAECVREVFGVFSIWLRPEVTAKTMRIDIHRLTVCGVPLPKFLLPKSSTFEWQDDSGRFRFDVSASAPGLGLLIRYQGWLTPVHDAAATG